MHVLPCIPIRNQRLGLQISDADLLELLAALSASLPDARRSNWSRLLRLSPTMLVWCKFHFSPARDLSALIDSLTCDDAGVLRTLIAPSPANPAANLDEKWFDQFRRFLGELDWATQSPTQPAPHLVIASGGMVSAPGGSTSAAVAKRSHNQRENNIGTARLVVILDTLLRPFWHDPLDELSRWLSKTFSNFSFELRPEDQVKLELATDEQSSHRIDSWRNGSSTTPSILTDVVEQLWRANRQAAHWRNEKLESLKQLAYGASHEINNPLANIATRAQLLVAGEKDDARRKQLITIFQQAMRAHEMISDMMLFAHPPEPDLQPVELVELVRKACSEFSPLVEQAGWTIDSVSDVGPINLQIDAGQIISLLQAIVQNSFESRSTGHIAVSCGLTQSQNAFIEVSDNGPGISVETARHMFDPFYSGREAGRGLGFGLSKAWTIARLHGGDICLKSTGATGTTISIELPAEKT